MLRTLCTLCLAVLLGVTGLQAQSLPEPMSPRRLVNDFAGLMSPAQQQALEQKLEAFDRETSTQIAVVTVDDLDGYAPGDYAQRLHDKWGVGRQGSNNGILVLVKPKTPGSKGEVFISVGYGLEGVVPDITAGRIIDSEMLPAFREGDMYGGIDKATGVLMQLTRGEFTAAQYQKKQENGDMFGGIILFIIFWIVVSVAVRSSKKGGGSGDSNDGSSGGGMWIPPIILGGGGRGGWGGGSGGGFGGFGGFGGGLSGGGGGGRSW